jgi:hypothetical protein
MRLAISSFLRLSNETTLKPPKPLSMGSSPAIAQVSRSATKGGRITIQLSLDDIEELQGYVAAEANHLKDTKLTKNRPRIQRSTDVS